MAPIRMPVMRYYRPGERRRRAALKPTERADRGITG